MRTIKIMVAVLFLSGVALNSLSTVLPAGSASSKDKTQKQNRKQSKTAPAKPGIGENEPPADPSQFIGSQVCAECHTDEAANFNVTAHRKTLGDEFRYDQHGCEACHGPARKHVEYHQTTAKLLKEGKNDEAAALLADEEKANAAKVRYFKSLSSAQASAVCLKCHESQQGRSEERFNFRRSEHFRHGVSCLDCHSSHSPKRTEFLLRNSQPNVCYACHQDQRAQFAKVFHHKVPEGTMRCSDCHNMHGGFLLKQLRSWVGSDVNCLKCHADKAGPFVYEHVPIKVEGCQACHTPHGSNNPRLLIRNEVRFLCLECHSNTPTIPGDVVGLGPPTPSFHDIRSPRFQNCTVCHVMIHGSNANPFYFH